MRLILWKKIRPEGLTAALDVKPMDKQSLCFLYNVVAQLISKARCFLGVESEFRKLTGQAEIFPTCESHYVIGRANHYDEMEPGQEASRSSKSHSSQPRPHTTNHIAIIILTSNNNSNKWPLSPPAEEKPLASPPTHKPKPTLLPPSPPPRSSRPPPTPSATTRTASPTVRPIN